MAHNPDAKKPTLSQAIANTDSDPTSNQALGVPWGQVSLLQYAVLFLRQIMLATIAASGKVASAAFQRPQTSATGTNYVQLASVACDQCTVRNVTGTALRLGRGSGADATLVGTYIVLQDGEEWLMRGLTNSNQVLIRRDDGSNTQVTAEVETEKL